MIIQATPYGTKKEEPFAFTYSGDFTDSRVDGIGDVTLNTSGTLVTTGKTVKVSVYILGAGGGGAQNSYLSSGSASGGGGGYQTVEVELAPGTYEIVIGTGGTSFNGTGNGSGGKGGDTTAFGFTSTGGEGGDTGFSGSAGGSPNGNAGQNIMYTYDDVPGGSPNGGGIVNATAQPGGDGYVELTFI